MFLKKNRLTMCLSVLTKCFLGLSPKKKENIFISFYRIRNSQRLYVSLYKYIVAQRYRLSIDSFLRLSVALWNLKLGNVLFKSLRICILYKVYRVLYLEPLHHHTDLEISLKEERKYEKKFVTLNSNMNTGEYIWTGEEES